MLSTSCLSRDSRSDAKTRSLLKRMAIMGAACLLSSATLADACFAASSAGLEPVAREALPPVVFNEAKLTVIGSNGAQIYTPRSLEALGAYRLVTRTPWREAPAEFIGARLSDVLEANGLSDATAVRVVAENDYAVVIAREVWERWPILIATRVDGQPHSVRHRGPLQFVFAQDLDPSVGEKTFEHNWVWMAARIEPAS